MTEAPPPDAAFRQQAWDVRAEWGPRGLRELVDDVAVVVIVDVLSFTTCVDLAVRRGATVWPCRFRGEEAAALARAHDALLAGDNPLGLSLRPASLIGVPQDTRLVLPSPNGSTLSAIAAQDDAGARPLTLAGCLRNARAVARRARAEGGPIAVLPSGERWRPEDSLRPALEDALGAGAVLAHLRDGFGSTSGFSPEALGLLATFEEARGHLEDRIAHCASGREKAARAQDEDVALAAALDVSDAVPVLRDGAYRAADGG